LSTAVHICSTRGPLQHFSNLRQYPALFPPLWCDSAIFPLTEGIISLSIYFLKPSHPVGWEYPLAGLTGHGKWGGEFDHLYDGDWSLKHIFVHQKLSLVRSFIYWSVFFLCQANKNCFIYMGVILTWLACQPLYNMVSDKCKTQGSRAHILPLDWFNS
jgi:hypothetical protein